MKFHILLYFNAVSHGALQSFQVICTSKWFATSQLSLRVAPVSSCPVVHRTLCDVYEDRMSVNVTHPRSVEMHHQTRPRWVCMTHDTRCNLRQAMYRRVFRGNVGLQPHWRRKRNVNSSSCRYRYYQQKHPDKKYEYFKIADTELRGFLFGYWCFPVRRI